MPSAAARGVRGRGGENGSTGLINSMAIVLRYCTIPPPALRAPSPVGEGFFVGEHWDIQQQTTNIPFPHGGRARDGGSKKYGGKNMDSLPPLSSIVSSRYNGYNPAYVEILFSGSCIAKDYAHEYTNTPIYQYTNTRHRALRTVSCSSTTVFIRFTVSLSALGALRKAALVAFWRVHHMCVPPLAGSTHW